jgi:hypothetical protein
VRGEHRRPAFTPMCGLVDMDASCHQTDATHCPDQTMFPHSPYQGIHHADQTRRSTAMRHTACPATTSSQRHAKPWCGNTPLYRQCRARSSLSELLSDMRHSWRLLTHHINFGVRRPACQPWQGHPPCHCVPCHPTAAACKTVVR